MNAKLIQDVLNGHGLVFRITDERIKQTTYEKSNDIVGVLEMVSGGYLYDQTGNRVITMQIEFVGANKDFETFREIINENFPNDELVDGFWVYSQPLQFPDFLENEGNKKFNARIVFQLVEVVGGVSGKNSTIKVDGVEIDFSRVTYRQDKTLMPFQAFGVNKNIGLVNEIFSIRLPMSDNPKNISLITEAIDNSYNASHQIEWTIGTVVKTFDAVLRVGLVEYPKNHEPLLFTITFERALPREMWGVATFQESDFWDVDDFYKPADDIYNYEITNEFDFREFLDTLSISQIGYVVRNEFIESANWENFNLTKAFSNVSLPEGEEIDDVIYYSGGDIDPAVWIRSNRNPDNYQVGANIKLIDEWGNQFISTIYLAGSNFSAIVYDTLDETILTASLGMIFLTFAQNRAETYNITEQGHILAVKIVYKDYEYYEELGGIPSQSDYLFGIGQGDGVGGFMIALREENINIYNYDNGAIMVGYKGARAWAAKVVTKNVYFYFRREIEGWIFSGTWSNGGNYASFLNASVVDYAAKHSVQTTTRQKGLKVVGKPLYYGNAFTVLFLISDVTQQFIDDLYNQSKAKYKIMFTIGTKTYSYEDMIVSDIDRQNSENANQVMQVTFTEGE